MTRYPRKPPWCAAFTGWCWRSAHEETGTPLKVELKAGGPLLRDAFKAAGLLIARDEFVDEPGKVGPGDMIIWTDHVALVWSGSPPAAAVNTIEGNAPGKQGIIRLAHQKNNGKRWKKLLGCGSVGDGYSVQAGGGGDREVA